MADPQVNPNALAAPAEGFGQTVTFAYDPSGSQVPQRQAVQSRGPNVGSSGGTRATLVNPNTAAAAAAGAATVDPTATLLMKVGKDILAKKVDEARSAEYVKGMQASMQGEALVDIKEQTPWYAKVFGDTPFIEGARAYEAQDTVNKSLGNMTRDMDKLKTLGPQEAAQYFNQAIQAVSKTGDTARDAVVMKSMLDGMPALMKVQAKAHYEWGQDKARKAMGQSIVSGARSLQELGEAFASDKISQADMDARSQQYLMSVIPPDGINEENYAKTLTAGIQQMAADGSFHAIEAIRKSGAFAALNPEQAKQVEANILMNANRGKDRYASQFVDQMAKLEADAQKLPNGMSPADVVRKAEGMNTAYKRLTGSPVDLYTSDELKNLGKGAILDMKRQAEKAYDRQLTLDDRNASADAKAAAAADLRAAVDSAVRTGRIDYLQMQTKATKDDIDQGFMRVIADPKANSSFIVNQAFIRTGYVNDILKNEYRADMLDAAGRGQVTDKWLAAVQRYDGMVKSAGGKDYAAAYFGDFAPRLERAHRMMNGNILNNPDADVIFKTSMSTDTWNKPQPLAAKEKLALSQKVASASSSTMPRWLGGKVPPRAASLKLLTDIAERNVEDWRGTGMNDTEAMATGIRQAITTGAVEVLGGFAIRNAQYQEGQAAPMPLRQLMSGDPNGSTYIAVPEGAQDEYFEGFLFDALKVPKDVGYHNFSRDIDAGGTQQFVLTATDKDNLTHIYRFSAKELQTYAGQRAHKDTKAREQGPLAWGPKITYTANVPTEMNMYITAAERARRIAAERRKTEPQPK